MSGDGTDRPCAGLKVVDLSQGMAGPLATMVLADYGADVVKVEPLQGDWARGRLRGFHMWNRGKRSIALDLADPASRDDLTALVQWADVVVTDTPPPGAGHTGLEHDLVHRANPAVIHCHVGTWVGRGAPGEPADEFLYEGQFAAATGQMAGRNLLSGRVVDRVRDDPTFVLPPANSYGAAMLAAQGVLGALTSRASHTGASSGECLTTSLLQGAMAFLMREDLERPLVGVPRPEIDVMHRGIELCFLTAECADGRYVQMCARQDHHFRAWLRALGLEDLLDEPRFAGAPLQIATVEDIDELERRLREGMRTRTQAEWMRIFTTEYDLGADPFLTPEEFLAHPQMVANGRVAEVDDPVLGPTLQVGALVAIDGATPTRFAPAPPLDAHSAEIRQMIAGRSAPAPPRSASRTAAGRRRPLAGVTILEMAYFVAGPLATTLMAELGARVIKVEPIDGDPYRRTGLQAAKFLAGKESIALNVKHPDGRRVLHELIARSDAFVHGFRAGVPERLGIDESTVRGIRPDIVYLNAASYGSRGPESGRVAFHSTPTALSGAGIAQAGRGNKPVDDSFPDPAAGLGAATALALGLFAQRRLGRGGSLETTMLTSTGFVMSNDLVVSDGRAHAAVADPEQLGLCALYRLYECRDGWVFVAAVDDGATERLAAALGDVALGDLALGGDDDERARRIADALRTWPRDTVLARLHEAGVAASPTSLHTIDRWLSEHGVLEPASHPGFPDFYLTPRKIDFAGREDGDRPVCTVGEHTAAILAELGRTRQEVDELLAGGAAAASSYADCAPVPRGGA